MSYGIIIRNSSGAITFDSQLVYVKFIQKISYNLTAASNWVLTLSIPGISADGTWYAQCGTSTSDTVHYVKSITTGQSIIHAPFGRYSSGTPIDSPGYLTIMRLS